MSNSLLFEMSLSVKAEHLDKMNHVNNVQYLQWVQDIAKAHWESLAENDWLEQYAWVALNHYIEYKKPAFLDDQLVLQTYVEEFSGVKSVRIVRFFNRQTKQLLSQAKTEWCLLDIQSLRPTRIPNALASKFFEGDKKFI